MIRNARIFKARLPEAHQTMASHLAELPFDEIREGEVKRQGFVPHYANGELVVPFPGGYAFTLRTDERIIPPSAVSAEMEKREAQRTAEGWPAYTKDEKREVRDDVIVKLAHTALAKTRYTFAYYLTGPGYLIVDTAAKKPAQEVCQRLVQVMEALETQTIHVSDVARGLTTKLLGELDYAHRGLDDSLESPPFGFFELCDAVKLKRPGASETVTYAGVDLRSQSDEIADQIRRGFRAIELRLSLDETEFKLCEDFALKSFSFPDPELSPADEEAAEEDRMVRWLADVQLETAAISEIVDALVELLRYEEPKGEEVA